MKQKRSLENTRLYCCSLESKLQSTIVIHSARISKKAEGGICIKIGYFFNAHPPFKGGGGYHK